MATPLRLPGRSLGAVSDRRCARIVPFAGKSVSGRKTERESGTAKVTVSGRKTISSRGRTEEVQFEKPRTRSSRTVKAEPEEEQEPQPNPAAELVADVKAKYEYLASRPQLVAAAGATVGALALTGLVITLVNEVPVVPKVLELAGVVYIAAFTYSSVLQPAGRKQLAKDLLALKDRVSNL